MRWLLRAQDATGDGGVSLGYFPCDETPGWWRSYPETTGYIISSLLNYAHSHQDEALSSRALRMAQWEIEIQMPNGAVQGGPVCGRDERTPCSFNTGMVLDGLVSAYNWTRDDTYLMAAQRAGDYLLSDLTEDGYFRTNGQFVAPGAIKTYNCLCAWSLYRLGHSMDDDRYRRAALHAVEAALRQQQANGWFANNCLSRPEAPLLHTICYTLQGILEVGILADREDFIAAVQRGAEPLLARVSLSGFVPGRFYPDWKPAGFSSCLTGSAQLAVICYRLYAQAGAARYRAAADHLANFLKALQVLDSRCAEINGALPGSFPLFGEYMTAGYPNWATKYLLDALMLQEQHSL